MYLYKEIEEFKQKIDLNTLYFVEQRNSESKIANLETGLINIQAIEKLLAKQKDNNKHLILLCGSKAMTGMFLKPMLIDLGYKDINIVAF